MNWRQTMIAALVLGIVAGAVVWWLERHETERMREQLFSEIGTYLSRLDEFKAWEAGHGGGAGA